ncbi:MAG: type II secretion system F family protein [Acetivibrio sp.]
MPFFDYVVIQKSGKEKKGSIEAGNEETAKRILKEEGYLPISIVPQSTMNKDINFKIGSGVKPRELATFCKQFETILGAGVTVINALEMLSEEIDNKILKNAIQNVQLNVEKGETLAGAMRLQGKVFPTILIDMIAAGEASGSLDNSFGRMSNHFTKENRLKAIIAKAMVYPCILLVVIIGVVAVMMIKIVPQFMESFEQLDAELPAITQVVIGVSNVLKDRWWVIVLLAVGTFFAIRQLKKTRTGALFFGRLELKIPLLGNLTIKTASARFTRTLSTLLGAGISLIDAVDIVGRTMSNAIIKKVMEEAKEDVMRGVPLSKPLEASGVFPAMVYHMTKIGEETGNMEEMLDQISNYYDEEVEIATEALTAAMEPMIIVVMAVLVVPIILAIMMPMMSIYSAAGV